MIPQPERGGLSGLGQEAFVGLPGRFVDCFHPTRSREGLLLEFLTWAGTYLGRSHYLRLGGREVPGNLFLLVVGQGASPGLAVVESFFRWFRPHPVIVRSGLSSGQSLVFQIRDTLLRSDKVYTDRGADPEWRPTVVDTGTAERRVIITQASLVRALTRRTAGARSLGEVLTDAYEGRDLAVFLGHRDGGFLRSTGPHISLAATCSAQEYAGLPEAFASLCLVTADVGGGMFGELHPGDEDKLTGLLMEFDQLPLEAAVPEVALAPAAAAIFERSLTRIQVGEPEDAALKLAKLGLLYAVVDRSDRITAEHARAAAAVVRHSWLTHHYLTDGVTIDRVAAAVEAALRRCPRGLSRTGINRVLQGKIKASVIQAALESLRVQGSARREVYRTPGRSVELWFTEEVRE